MVPSLFFVGILILNSEFLVFFWQKTRDDDHLHFASEELKALLGRCDPPSPVGSPMNQTGEQGMGNRGGILPSARAIQIKFYTSDRFNRHIS